MFDAFRNEYVGLLLLWFSHISRVSCTPVLNSLTVLVLSVLSFLIVTFLVEILVAMGPLNYF